VTPQSGNVPTVPADDDPAQRPFPTSICHGCAHLRLTGNKRGSIFLQCGEPSRPKYLPQPIVRCPVRLAIAEPTP